MSKMDEQTQHKINCMQREIKRLKDASKMTISLTEKQLEKSSDPKDTEIYPEPPTHHYIKCRICKKRSRVCIRYTLHCNTCRSSTSYKNMLKETKCWGGWHHNALLGEAMRHIPHTGATHEED